MADNEMSLLMRIRTMFEGKGAKDAVTAVDNVAKSANNVGRQAAAASNQSEKAFGAINAAAQVTEGGVMGVGSAVRNLAGQFPKLAGALGPIGLAIAAFAAWKAAYDGIIAMNKEMKQGLDDIKAGNFEASVRNLAKDYNELADAMGRAADETSRLVTIRDALVSSQRQLDDAKSEQAKQKALARLDPEDDLGARRVETEYARQAAITAASRDQEDAARKSIDLKREASREDEKAEAAEARKADIVKKVEEAIRITTTLQSEKDKKLQAGSFVKAFGVAGNLLYENARGKIRNEYTEKINASVDRQQKLFDEAKAQDAIIQTANRNAMDKRSLAGILDERSPTVAAMRRETADTVASSATYNIDQEKTKRDDAKRAIQDEYENAKAERDQENIKQVREERQLAEARDTASREENEAKQAENALRGFRPGMKRIGGRLATRDMMVSAASKERGEADAAMAQLARVEELYKQNQQQIADRLSALSASMDQFNQKLSNTRTSDSSH